LRLIVHKQVQRPWGAAAGYLNDKRLLPAA
jgi:hypothetical protein